MFLKQNKMLVLGTVAAAAVWLGVYWLLINDNWVKADAAKAEAEKRRGQWDAYFEPKNKLLPQPEADKALNDSNEKLRLQLEELKKIEFGTPETLHAFSEAAAGSGDHKNYLATLKTQLATKAKDNGIAIPPDLGIVDKAAEDPVALNLLRLAIVDRFVLACKEAGVVRVRRLRHDPPLPVPGNEAKEAPADTKKGAAPPAEPPDSLIQYPMRVVVQAPERFFAQFLYELQKPSDATHGYFCLRGFHVIVGDAASGTIEASVAFTAMLSQKTAGKLGVAPKTDEDRRSAPRPETDYSRY